MSTITERLARHGFVLEGTGGGCTAYVRRSADGFEELITDDDAQAPTRLDSVAWVSNYDNGGPTDDMETATVREMLAALDNPSDEYCLLSLRLANGLHKR